MIVLDANILIRAVLGRRVRQIIEKYAPLGVRFYTPDFAFNEVRRHLPPLLKKQDKPDMDVPLALQYLQGLIEPVGRDLYGSFEGDARRRLRGRDENDWPVIATSLALACHIWTEDADFFGTGIAVWTTSRIEIFLEAQVKSPE